MNILKTYDTYLTFHGLTTERVRQIQALFQDQNLVVNIDSYGLEFDFQGRDFSDYIVHLFQQVASIVNFADGEIRCELNDGDSPDPKYKFFTIRDGTLWEQTGEIVRSEQVKPVEWTPPK
jgi:hypothetical protein